MNLGVCVRSFNSTKFRVLPFFFDYCVSVISIRFNSTLRIFSRHSWCHHYHVGWHCAARQCSRSTFRSKWKLFNFYFIFSILFSKFQLLFMVKRAVFIISTGSTKLGRCSVESFGDCATFSRSYSFTNWLLFVKSHFLHNLMHWECQTNQNKFTPPQIRTLKKKILNSRLSLLDFVFFKIGWWLEISFGVHWNEF